MQRCSDAEEHPVLRSLLRAANLVQPTAESVDQGLAHGPAPLDGQDVAADRLRDLLAQIAEPVAHRFMAALGPVGRRIRAADPRWSALPPVNVPISVQ